MEQSDSREKLFDSSLNTVNVSVNTELPMDSSSKPKEEVTHYFHFYGDRDDDVFHKVISVNNLAYSTSYNDEDCDNGERHTYAGLKPCKTGLETCDVLKPTRHGNEPLVKSIQSATEKGDSGIDNIAYLSGDDTRLGTDHTKADVYESSDNMLVSHSISRNQSESLEEILDFGSFKSSPCTVVSFQEKHSFTDLDPSTVLRSSEVPNPWDKWEDVDLASFCVFDEMPLEIYD